jgi:hypothetical protein
MVAPPMLEVVRIEVLRGVDAGRGRALFILRKFHF